MKLLLSEKQYNTVNEGVDNYNSNVAAPLRNRWHRERSLLKKYIINYGQPLISLENGKEYKGILDSFISNLLGVNYCVCVQWDSMTNMPGEIIYVRAYDKFRPKQ